MHLKTTYSEMDQIKDIKEVPVTFDVSSNHFFLNISCWNSRGNLIWYQIQHVCRGKISERNIWKINEIVKFFVIIVYEFLKQSSAYYRFKFKLLFYRIFFPPFNRKESSYYVSLDSSDRKFIGN